VRVVAIGPPGGVDQLLATPDADVNAGYSVEFCGGTHLTNTGQVGRGCWGLVDGGGGGDIGVAGALGPSD